MNNRRLKMRVLGVMLILVLAVMAAGCQPKLTPKETLQKIQDTAMAQKNYSAIFEGQMDMTFDGDIPPETAPYMEMFKNIKFNGDMQIKDTDKLADLAMHYSVDLNGMGMKLEAYFDGDKMIIKYPVLPQYIVLDFNELFGKLSENGEMPEGVNYPALLADVETLSNTWLPGFYDKVLEGTDESTMELLDSYEFTINGTTTKSKAIKIKMTAETMLAMINAAIDQAKESHELYDVIKKYDTTGEMGSFEKYQADLEAGKAEIATDLQLDSVKDAMQNIEYSYIIGYDKKYNPTMMAMDMNMKVDDEATALKSTIHMQAVYQMDYKPVEVTIPEINDENSMSLITMMGGMLPGSSDDYDVSLEDSMNQDGDVPYNFMLEDQVAKIDDLEQAIAAMPDMSNVEGLLESAMSDDYLDIMNVYFASADGTMYLWPSQELPADYNPTERPYYTEAIDQDYSMPELYQDAASGMYVQSIAKKVVVDGNVIGVVGIDFIVQ